MPRQRKPGEGSTYQERPGRWVGWLSLGFELQPDGTRKRSRKKFTGTSLAAVQRKMVEARRLQLNGGIVRPDRETVEAYLRRWLARIDSQVAVKTFHDYTRIVERYLVPALGHLKLGRLQPADVQRMMSALIKRGLSARTAGYAHAVLRAALGEAEKQGLVARNAAALSTPPRVQKREVLPLSADDARRLLVSVQGDRFDGLFHVLLLLGLRVGEALGLRWTDIDFERRTVTVRRSLLRTGGEWKTVNGQRKQTGTKLLFAECKTERSHRTLVMPAPLIAALLRRKEQQERDRHLAADGWREHGLVTTTSIGTPTDPRAVGKRLDQALQALGLSHVKVHALRHTAATLLISMGHSLAQVQQILGHAQIALTADLYGHLVTSQTARPLEQLGQLLAPEVAPSKPVATLVAPSEHPNRPN